MNALTIPSANGLQHRTLIDAFLQGRTPDTRRAYGQDVADFAAFLGVPDIDAAARTLLSQEPGTANLIVLEYRTHLSERDLAPATINRRLASLRSLVKLARTIGVVTWALDISNIRAQSYKDTRGPGVYRVRRMISEAESRGDSKGRRDSAILHLLFDLGLRRGEVCKLDLADVDLPESAIHVLGKGRLEKERLSLPEPTKRALASWIDDRGTEPGPLFLSRSGRRLDGSSLYYIVRTIGESIGIKTRPHGLRHSGITEAVKAATANGMDLTEVLPFSRHRNVSTLQVYRDTERDTQGKLAAMVAGTG